MMAASHYGIDVHSSPLVSEFAPLTFRQRSAAWYGAQVTPGRAFYVIAKSIVCHPSTFRLLHDSLPSFELAKEEP